MIKSDSRFLFCDKPAGITTHTSHGGQTRHNPTTDPNDGFCEWLSDWIGTKLYTVHRLDRDTTGTLIFALNPESASELSEKFARREIHKKYLFLTDRDRPPSTDTVTTVESKIEKRNGQWQSIPSENVNSSTRFRWIEQTHGIHLWEAEPLTGKPHQIRLHAADLGLPILGDRDHGGSPFPALCLHSRSISFTDSNGKVIQFESSPPYWFINKLSIEDQTFCRWLAGIDRRQRVLNTLERVVSADKKSEVPVTRKNSDLLLRWLHTEADPLRVDQLGEVISMSWFEQTPNDQDWDRIHRLVQCQQWNQWYLQVRGNRGKTPNQETVYRSTTLDIARWTAEEDGISYEFRTDSGLSPGLFLDQKVNRKWVRQQSQGKDVLNLFCYTGGFSVNAAVGGAKKIVSVDTSRNFLEWTKRNFELNHLPVDTHDFRAMDCLEYLAWAKKKNLKFDLVVCDPPSFGRSKNRTFKLEKDFSHLFKALLSVLNKDGIILFSTNFEKWNQEDLYQNSKKALFDWKDQHQNKTNALREEISFEFHSCPSPFLDFELPNLDHNLKSLLLKAKPN